MTRTDQSIVDLHFDIHLVFLKSCIYFLPQHRRYHPGRTEGGVVRQTWMPIWPQVPILPPPWVRKHSCRSTGILMMMLLLLLLWVGSIERKKCHRYPCQFQSAVSSPIPIATARNGIVHSHRYATKDPPMYCKSCTLHQTKWLDVPIGGVADADCHPKDGCWRRLRLLQMILLFLLLFFLLLRLCESLLPTVSAGKWWVPWHRTSGVLWSKCAWTINCIGERERLFMSEVLREHGRSISKCHRLYLFNHVKTWRCDDNGENDDSFTTCVCIQLGYTDGRTCRLKRKRERKGRKSSNPTVRSADCAHRARNIMSLIPWRFIVYYTQYIHGTAIY